MKKLLNSTSFILLTFILAGCNLNINNSNLGLLNSQRVTSTIVNDGNNNNSIIQNSSFKDENNICNSISSTAISPNSTSAKENNNNESFDTSDSINISLNGDSISCNSNKVLIEDTSITILDEGTFVFSGTLSNGKIIIDAEETDKPKLVLNNASISNTNYAPLYILEADKVHIISADNTINELINGGTFTAIDDNNVDGTIFSKQDLTFNGNGTLNVSSPSGHGIVCKDDLVFKSGTYNITANNHGLDVNDSIKIGDSTLTITSGKDGIHCENSDDETLGYIYISSGNINVQSRDDGISSNSTLQIENGIFNIKTNSSYTTANSSIKGLKSTSNMLINNGYFTINSYDDAVHSNSSIEINGGVFEITTNDDAFHADETLNITNGNIKILKSYEGLEALNIKISGGDISLIASDDGINAAGGNDSSGVTNPGFPSRPGGGGWPGDNFGGGANSNGSIEISGGNLYIQASGDGIDANGTLLISGGKTYVCGPTSGDTSVLDYDKTGQITGGEFYGSGANKMVQTLTGTNQGVLSLKVNTTSANSTITVTNTNNEIVAQFTPKLSYQLIMISNSKIIKGQIYTIKSGSVTTSATAK